MHDTAATVADAAQHELSCKYQFKQGFLLAGMAYRTNFIDSVASHISLGNLCANNFFYSIEKDIRILFHSMRLSGAITVDLVQPLTQKTFQQLQTKRTNQYTLCCDTRAHTEHFLNNIFYTHTAIALQDWEAYTEMQMIAQALLRVSLKEIPLPSQSLEQGPDIINIMKNIHSFVAQHHFCQATHTFIEKAQAASDRRQLNTLSVRHIANSLRTHGIGIVNTTTNIVYQFLRRRMMILSQFLYDDHIRSLLKREQRRHTDENQKLQVDSAAAFQRAQRMMRELRKLGPADSNVSCLDSLCHLICEVGNAIWFVQLMRLGSMCHANTSFRFTPDLSGTSEYEYLSLCETGSQSTVTILNSKTQATTRFEQLLKSRREEGEAVDYAKMLKSVFRSELQRKHNSHLHDFHLILPATTIRYVEENIVCKEGAPKRTKSSTAFTTRDGFAMGIAFLLCVLDQDAVFDSRNW
eukprot:CAMPEP_0183794240 /NCGR_PEP_ID=MMETSP0803_2-20130417/3715_1 /TAXON_ID=195967 /ORGANISM="Crustomastix stigmata, Strain CCMP3273" /LENGTH=465 /DNA_ID=CAMNT_0026038639 /DNA_START=1966 /DNA_END=3360 /DNA_ORIENTATION=-